MISRLSHSSLSYWASPHRNKTGMPIKWRVWIKNGIYWIAITGYFILICLRGIMFSKWRVRIVMESGAKSKRALIYIYYLRFICLGLLGYAIGCSVFFFSVACTYCCGKDSSINIRNRLPPSKRKRNRKPLKLKLISLRTWLTRYVHRLHWSVPRWSICLKIRIWKIMSVKISW